MICKHVWKVHLIVIKTFYWALRTKKGRYWLPLSKVLSLELDTPPTYEFSAAVENSKQRGWFVCFSPFLTTFCNCLVTPTLRSLCICQCSRKKRIIFCYPSWSLENDWYILNSRTNSCHCWQRRAQKNNGTLLHNYWASCKVESFWLLSN